MKVQKIDPLTVEDLTGETVEKELAKELYDKIRTEVAKEIFEEVEGLISMWAVNVEAWQALKEKYGSH